MKKYILLEENNAATHLKIETYYSLGGMNYFTGKSEQRGYYLSVSPVTRARGMESFTAFTGIKKCVKTVTRKSANAEKQAEENAMNYVYDLVAYVCKQNDLKIPAEFIAPE